MNDEIEPDEPTMEQIKEQLEERIHISSQFATVCQKLQNDGHSSISIFNCLIEFTGITIGTHLMTKDPVTNIIASFANSIEEGFKIREQLDKGIEMELN
jgi:hypothetical protein